MGDFDKIKQGESLLKIFGVAIKYDFFAIPEFEDMLEPKPKPDSNPDPNPKSNLLLILLLCFSCCVFEETLFLFVCFSYCFSVNLEKGFLSRKNAII